MDGWAGDKSWGSMEGELVIRASADATGHLTLRFELPGAGAPHCTASVNVTVADRARNPDFPARPR